MIFSVFGENTVCSIHELTDRWKCTATFVYEQLVKGIIRSWKPEEPVGPMGILIDVKTVVAAEAKYGLLNFMWNGNLCSKIYLVKGRKCLARDPP